MVNTRGWVHLRKTETDSAFFVHFLCMHVRVCMHVPWHVCGGQKRTSRSQVFRLGDKHLKLVSHLASPAGCSSWQEQTDPGDCPFPKQKPCPFSKNQAGGFCFSTFIV